MILVFQRKSNIFPTNLDLFLVATGILIGQAEHLRPVAQIQLRRLGINCAIGPLRPSLRDGEQHQKRFSRRREKIVDVQGWKQSIGVGHLKRQSIGEQPSRMHQRQHSVFQRVCVEFRADYTVRGEPQARRREV